ncbi:11865_t:CDS:2, partial [Funneliformis mosseae]
ILQETEKAELPPSLKVNQSLAFRLEYFNAGTNVWIHYVVKLNIYLHASMQPTVIKLTEYIDDKRYPEL